MLILVNPGVDIMKSSAISSKWLTQSCSNRSNNLFSPQLLQKVTLNKTSMIDLWKRFIKDQYKIGLKRKLYKSLAAVFVCCSSLLNTRFRSPVDYKYYTLIPRTIKIGLKFKKNEFLIFLLLLNWYDIHTYIFPFINRFFINKKSK